MEGLYEALGQGPVCAPVPGSVLAEKEGQTESSRAPGEGVLASVVRIRRAFQRKRHLSQAVKAEKVFQHWEQHG